MILQILLATALVQAQVRSNLFTKPSAKPLTTLRPSASSKATSSSKTEATTESGNLPSEYGRRTTFSSAENPISVPTNKSSQRLGKVPLGEVIQAKIIESVFAFTESKSPIRALVTSGDLKGAVFIGEANLEKNSKRILIQFKNLRIGTSKDIWSLQGSVLDGKGILGVEGKVISGEAKYFGAEFLSAAAAGYADATVQRSQNALGNYVEAPGVDTFAKKALASALSKTSDRFSEKLKSVPEYAVLEGPFPIQILITEQPKLSE